VLAVGFRPHDASMLVQLGSSDALHLITTLESWLASNEAAHTHFWSVEDPGVQGVMPLGTLTIYFSPDSPEALYGEIEQLGDEVASGWFVANADGIRSMTSLLRAWLATGEIGHVLFQARESLTRTDEVGVVGIAVTALVLDADGP
jgi:hypothetical protein